MEPEAETVDELDGESKAADCASAASGRPANATHAARGMDKDIVGIPMDRQAARFPAGHPVMSTPRNTRCSFALSSGAALPLWPVSGLTSSRIHLPTRQGAQWLRIDFAATNADDASLTVAGAAQVDARNAARSLFPV